LAALQRKKDNERVAPKLRTSTFSSEPIGKGSVVVARETKGLPPVHRAKPLEQYKPNALRSVPVRTFIGERNFKKIPNYRNISQITFSGMDGHSFVNNPQLRYSTTFTLAHSEEAVKKIGTENPSITCALVKLIHDKKYK